MKQRMFYPNQAIHPMKSWKSEPWLFYDLDDCEKQYIFGFRSNPCPGDELPAELHPDKVQSIMSQHGRLDVTDLAEAGKIAPPGDIE